MDPLVVTAAVVVAGHGLSLVALRLHLRAQLRREHAYYRFLLAVAQALPAGSQFHEQRADGTCLTLAVRPDLPGSAHG